MVMDRRRDTPAQDSLARRVEQDRQARYQQGAVQEQTGTRMDTPAQDANMRRQQSPAGGRATWQARVGREQDRAYRIGEQGGPFNRVRGAMTATNNARNGGPPNTGPAITPLDQARQGNQADAIREFPSSAMSSIRRSASNAVVGANPGPAVTREDIARQGQQADQVRGFLGGLRGVMFNEEALGQGSGFTQEQLNGGQAFPRGQDQRGSGGLSGVGSALNNVFGTGNPMSLASLLTGQLSGGSMLQGGQSDGGDSGPATVNQSALDAAAEAGRYANTGYIQPTGGRRQFIEGTQRSNLPPGLSVTGDFGAAANNFAEANAIRQQYIDSQRPQNQVSMIPDSGFFGRGQASQGGVRTDIERLARQASMSRDPYTRAGLNRQINQLTALQQLGQERAMAQEDNTTSRANTQTNANAMLQQAMIGAQRTEQPSGTDIYNMTRAERMEMQNGLLRQGLPAERPTLDSDQLEALQMTGNEGLIEQQINDVMYRQTQYDAALEAQRAGMTLDQAAQEWAAGELDGTALGDMLGDLYGEPEGFAEGGLVEGEMGPNMDYGSAIGMGTPQPGMDMMSMGGGPMGGDPVQTEYQQYAMGSQQLGIDPVPFEDFVQMMSPQQMQQQAPPGAMEAMAFAEGGYVPGSPTNDVSGEMVVDPNPMAGTDSIPATIDGMRPAKLDSGEFVIPKSAVMFHGIDKLNKLIAQAEQKGQQNGADSGTEGTASAVNAARA